MMTSSCISLNNMKFIYIDIKIQTYINIENKMHSYTVKSQSTLYIHLARILSMFTMKPVYASEWVVSVATMNAHSAVAEGLCCNT